MGKYSDKKVIATLGDINWQDYGGTFVIEHKQHHTSGCLVNQPPVKLSNPETYTYAIKIEEKLDHETNYTIYQFGIPKVDPDQEWFGEHLETLKRFADLENLKAMFQSDNVNDRLLAYSTVGDYFGYENLDGYPRTLTKKEMYNQFRCLYK